MFPVEPPLDAAEQPRDHPRMLTGPELHASIDAFTATMPNANPLAATPSKRALYMREWRDLPARIARLEAKLAKLRARLAARNPCNPRGK